MKGLHTSQQQTVKRMRELNDRTEYMKVKLEEVETLLPLLVKHGVGVGMKLHMEEMDAKKVDVEVFKKSVKSKAERSEVSDLRKEV